MGDDGFEIALHLRAEHGEGPRWDGPTARLWWVDITRQRVHCFDPASGCDCSWPTAGQPGGVVLDDRGEPVVATPDGLAVLERTTGRAEVVVPIEPDRTGSRTNDLTVDPWGRLWVGTMTYEKRAGAAALYRVDGDRPDRVVDGLTVSNGPAFDPDGGRMYLADTALGVVDVFAFDGPSGAIGERRRFLDVGAAGHWPDGMAVDDEGMLWVALGRAGAVHRYDRSGRLSAVLELPTSNPTAVAFGGADGGELYVTTSWFDLAAADRATQEWAGAIHRFRAGVTGPPSPRCRPLRERP